MLQYLKKIKSLAPLEKEASFKTLLSWCVQVARGMAHLEWLNIIHHDLAARNVLLDENANRAKVADFGLSSINQDRNSATDQLAFRWTAPEVLVEKKCSSASDVWSFGILM